MCRSGVGLIWVWKDRILGVKEENQKKKHFVLGEG